VKVLFLVNGSEHGAAANRARAFAERLPKNWGLRIAYRPARKWKGIVPFFQLALNHRPQIVYVMDVAYTGVIAGCLAKRLIGCRLVTDTGDAAYALAKSTGNYSRAQLALIRETERMALKWSNAVIVRGSYHKELLEEGGVPRVEFVPDGVSLEADEPVNASNLRAELGLACGLVMGLVGTMAWSTKHRMCYGWDVIEALGRLKDAPVKALLIGDGNGRNVLEARARELGVKDRVVFTGTLPFAALPPYLSAMDVCVSTQSNDLVGKVRTTGKLPLYLAYGKYVIATNVGEASRVLPGVGCLLPYEGVRDDKHPRRLAEQVRRLIAEPALLCHCEQARQVAAKNFEYGMLARRIEALCREIAPA